MTDLDLLKDFREDTPAPTPEALTAARQQLLTPLAERPHNALRPPRLATTSPAAAPDAARERTRSLVRRPRLLLAGAMALVLAGGFLVADVVTRDGATPAGTVANASTFLAEAATASSADPDDPIPPGQYLEISYRTTRLTPLGDNPSLRATQYGERTTWIASDRKPPYVTTMSFMTRAEFASPEARELAKTKAPYLFHPMKPGVLLNSCPTVGTETGVLVRGAKPCEPSWENTTYEFLAAQPRDPDLLLAALRKNPPMPAPDAVAWRRIGSVLSTGLVPPDLRAALYEAARKIPGIKLLDEVVTVDGRRARVIGHDGGGYRDDLLIAESGGQFLGRRIVVTKDGPPDINGDPEPSLQRGDILYSAIATTRITSTPPPSK